MNWIVQPLPGSQRVLLAAVTLGFVLSSSVQAAPESAEFGATLPPLLDLLERQSPELRAAGYERQAAWERPDVAGALPDPMLTFEEMGIARDDPSLSPSGVGSTRYAFRQTFPLGGKRGLAREIAEAGAEQAVARERLSRVELRSLVKLAFNEYQYAYAATQVTEELRTLVDELESIAQARYRVGLAPQQDVIKAQTEHTSLQSELLTLERDRRGTAARLNGILARPANSPLAKPAGWSALPASVPTLAELQARIFGGNPQVAELNARIQEARRAEELASRNWIPDVTVGTAVVQMGNRAEEFELMLEMNVPLWGKRRSAEQREAVSMRYAAEARREAVNSRLAGSVGEAWSALETAFRQHALTARTLLPQAELTYQSALASYQTGNVDFATLLDAQRQIRQLRLSLLSYELEQRVRVVELERLVGAEL
ncbi:TolC family protein [Stutzerimonas nitrititolerans]|uniref:TolC family protein n=1 Tax=Stutzerimonas nitrititolerans TaxID=2482751 RepID=UPI00289F3F4C|nr:TolC family protein [Stutzerimonas nitrititolerans]